MTKHQFPRQILELCGNIRIQPDNVLQEKAGLAKINALLQEEGAAVHGPEWVDLLGACCGRGWLTASTVLIDAGVPFTSDAPSLPAEEFAGFMCSNVGLEAASAPHAQILDLLVHRGAWKDGIFHTGEESALHWAAYFQRPNSIQWLLSRGMDVDIPNAEGQTSLLLLCALAKESLEPSASDDEIAPMVACARILIAAGADIDHRAKDGSSAHNFVEEIKSLPCRHQLKAIFAAADAKKALEQDTPQPAPSKTPGSRL